MHDVTWKFYVFQFLQIFQIELQNQNRAKYTKYLPIPFLLSFVNGPLRSPIALALMKKINAYFWGSLIRREALKFEDCRYESLQHGLARGHLYWRNVKWFPWKVGRTRDKRRKPRREAEWFPAYRVFSQPLKCLHQAM